MNDPEFATVVMTVPERCHSYACPREAIEELEDAGLWLNDRRGVRVDRCKKDGPHLAYLKAAQFALYAWPSAEWIFIAQDDIEVTQGLSQVLWGDIPDTGVVSLFTPRHAHLRRPGAGWWQIDRMRGSFGGQLIAWRRPLLERYVMDWPNPDRQQGADHEILIWCRDRDIPWWFHNPSYVWHAGADRSSLNQAGGSEFGRQCAEFLTKVGGRVKLSE